jgi:OTU domain-containing protein 4
MSQYYRKYQKQRHQIDEELSKRKLKRKYVAKDGSCLFRAVAEQAWHVQTYHWDLRRKCAEHIQKRRKHFEEFLTEPINDYCFKLKNSHVWGGEPELKALSELLDCTITVYSIEKHTLQQRDFTVPRTSGWKAHPPIRLAFVGNNHYDIVWTEERERNYNFCQAVVYDMLYSEVFKIQLPERCRYSTLSDIKRDDMRSGYPQDLLKAFSYFIYYNIPLELANLERKSKSIIFVYVFFYDHAN